MKNGAVEVEFKACQPLHDEAELLMSRTNTHRGSVLRGISGPKRQQVRADWRKLHN
jgi:hypothetical protein